MLKLGSLFDGAGGFPFAAQQYGIKPVWASEIEPFPVAVTTRRFPEMKHLGDVSKVNGAEVEPVDIITFGSPCQDLSVAGKRAGLDGERSGLFMQAIRIIKEMRSATNGRYPRVAVWENVPGAFSSAKGEDFRAVLEAFCQVIDENANVPRPADGKWHYAGEIVGDGYSVAWRTLDAQYWGVPQRRRRIFLVADFGGGCAGEILFEREGLSRNFAESRASWQGITKSVAFGVGDKERAATVFNESGVGYWMPGFGCLRAEGENRPSRPNHCVLAIFDTRGNGDGQVAPTITGDHQDRVTDYTAVVVGDAVLCVRERCGCEGGGKGCLVQENVAGELACHNDQFLCYPILAFQAAGDRDNPTISVSDKAFCIPANAMSDRGQAVLCIAPACGEVVNLNKDDIQSKAIIDPRGIAPALYAGECRGGGGEIYTLYLLKNGCVALDRATYNQGQNAQYDMGIDDSGTAHTVIAKGPGAVCYAINSKQQSLVTTEEISNTLGANDYKEPQVVCYLIPIEIILRRLTPTECARLQGMPDWWCDDVPHSDSAEYKMWGNGMALPCVLYVMEGVAKYLTEKEGNDEHTAYNA